MSKTSRLVLQIKNKQYEHFVFLFPFEKKNGGLESDISMQYKVLHVPADIYLVFVNLFLKPSTSNLLVIQKKPSRTSIHVKDSSSHTN